jgi:hypothetical protein
VRQSEGEITLYQWSYANKILEQAGLAGYNSCQTPMECHLKLIKDDGGTVFDAILS